MSARKWFVIHSLAGFYFGFLLLFVCVSGSLAVVSHEIEYLSDTKYRATGTASSVQWTSIQRQLEQNYPGYRILSLELSDQNYLAGEISLVREQEFLFVYFDPATGLLTGDGKWGRFSRYLRNLHMYLSMGDTGKLLVTTLSLLLFMILFSSFYVYRGWWRGLFKFPGKLLLLKRTLWSDWHKWIGVYCWPFILLMALTGFWYFSEFILLRAKIEHYPSAPELSKAADPENLLNMPELIQIARRAAPWLEVRAINFPIKSNTPVLVTGQHHNSLYRNRANRVYLHPNTGEILQLQHQADLNVVASLVDIADPLHFGCFGGLGVKLLYLLFGVGLSFLIGSGLWLHRLRTKRQHPDLFQWYGLNGTVCLVIVVAALWRTTATFHVREITELPYSPVLIANNNDVSHPNAENGL